jgi:hypothetical protein
VEACGTRERDGSDLVDPARLTVELARAAEREWATRREASTPGAGLTRAGVVGSAAGGGCGAGGGSAGPASGSRSSVSRPSSPLGCGLPPGTSRDASASPSTSPTLIDRASAGRERAAVTEPATGTVRDDRRTFLRCRHRALVGSAGVLVALIALAAVFVAPNRLASLQLGEVALAWWVAAAVALTGLVAVVRGFRAWAPPASWPARRGSRPRTRRGVGLARALARPSASPAGRRHSRTLGAGRGRRGHHDRVAAPGDPMEPDRRPHGVRVDARTGTLAGSLELPGSPGVDRDRCRRPVRLGPAGRCPRGWRDGRLAPRGDDAGRGLLVATLFRRISRGSG